MQILLSLMLLMAGCTLARAATVSIHKLDRGQQAERIASDLKFVGIYRTGLSNVLAFAREQTNLFPVTKPDKQPLPRREEKEMLWQAWKCHLDYLMALDSLDSYHGDWLRLSGENRSRSFAAGYAAFLAKYRFSLDLVELAERNPFVHAVLNEAVPELGLPAGTYARLKFRFLNPLIATDYAARTAVFQTMRSAAPADLRETMAGDAAAILRMGGGKGELLTVKNALKILKSTGDATWFPVQAGVSEWMGDTKVLRRDRSLISIQQAQALQKKLLPGDVLLVRREWYLSNVGLPGFWPHAALYVGTSEERKAFFADKDVVEWIKEQDPSSTGFEALLKHSSATAYDNSLHEEHGHQPRVIEAMSEGVSFTTLEHCLDADSAVVLRPLRSKTEKASAILRAFHYIGRPYDFNFDFATDAELVCTELVYKSYEPGRGIVGLDLPLEKMLGRQLLPANRIASQFDEQYGTDKAQFEFISFLDGLERTRKAVESGVEEFRQSWRRPKWHIVVQKSKK